MYEIADWQRYEVNSRGQPATHKGDLRVGPLSYVRLKVHGHSQSNGYRKLLLVAGPRSMEVFGIFCKFLEIAGDSRENQRGILRKERDGEPANIEDLSFLLAAPVEQIENAVKVLSDKRLQWLNELKPGVPRESPGKPGNSLLNTTQPNSIQDNTIQPNTTDAAKKSSQEILELDCLINQERKAFIEGITQALKPGARSAPTLAKVTKFLVEQVQGGQTDVGVFARAVEWAEAASRTTVKNKIGLFVAKVKEQTGFNSEGQLLKGAKNAN